MNWLSSFELILLLYNQLKAVKTGMGTLHCGWCDVWKMKYYWKLMYWTVFIVVYITVISFFISLYTHNVGRVTLTSPHWIAKAGAVNKINDHGLVLGSQFQLLDTGRLLGSNFFKEILWHGWSIPSRIMLLEWSSNIWRVFNSVPFFKILNVTQMWEKTDFAALGS